MTTMFAIGLTTTWSVSPLLYLSLRTKQGILETPPIILVEREKKNQTLSD